MLRNLVAIFALLVVGILSAFPVPQLDFNPKQYQCFRTEEEIAIDGRNLEDVWLDAAWTDEFVDIEGDLKPLPSFTTRVKMLWDDKYFYFYAELEDPNVWATLTERDAVIFHDNDFEIFIDPDGDTHNYYEYEVNAFNTVWDLLLLNPYRDNGQVAIDSWNITGLKSAVYVDGTINDHVTWDKGWSVEVAIPWKVLEECSDLPAPPKDKDYWRVNFSRVHHDTKIEEGKYVKLDKPEYNWVWSPQGLIAMHYPEMWGFVQFSTQLAGSKVENFKIPEEELVKMNLRYIYYAQKVYYEKHNKWASSLSKLEYKLKDIAGWKSPKLYNAGQLYQVSIMSKDKKIVWSIDNMGHTWKTDLEEN